MQITAAVAVRFDANASFSVVKSAIDDGEIRNAAACGTADGNAVSIAVNAIGDEHVGCAAAAGEIVVAHAYVAVLNKNVFAADIACIGVVAGIHEVGGRG